MESRERPRLEERYRDDTLTLRSPRGGWTGRGDGACEELRPHPKAAGSSRIDTVVRRGEEGDANLGHTRAPVHANGRKCSW